VSTLISGFPAKAWICLGVAAVILIACLGVCVATWAAGDEPSDEDQGGAS